MAPCEPVVRGMQPSSSSHVHFTSGPLQLQWSGNAIWKRQTDGTKIDFDLVAKWPLSQPEHYSLDPRDQSGAMLSGESTASQLNSLLVVFPSPLLTGQVLERIATEFNQLQFHAVQSKGMPLLDKVRPVSVGWGWALGCREP